MVELVKSEVPVKYQIDIQSIGNFPQSLAQEGDTLKVIFVVSNVPKETKMTSIKNGVANFQRGQAMMQFVKNMPYDSKIEVYGRKETQFKVKNMRTNNIIGYTVLNLADCVDVKNHELTLILDHESPLNKPVHFKSDDEVELRLSNATLATTASGMEDS